jgi:catechol 2,3-dioxygenase-like lactoylglutathione lyase family enzyme
MCAARGGSQLGRIGDVAYHKPLTRGTAMSSTLARCCATLILSLCAAGTAAAQLSPGNAAGVAMGHLHFVARDVAATKAWWVKLGGEPVTLLGIEGAKFPDVIVLLRQGEPTGTSEDAVVSHVAFRVKSVAELAKKGFDVQLNAEYPGVAYVHTPDGERIELFDDGLATNIGFAVDGGGSDAAADRHNRKLAVPIITHHVHFNVTEDQLPVIREWYATHFGGVRGKRWRYDAVDLPGINLNFSAVPAARAPTKGRALDHIGFEIADLEVFCRRLEAAGVKFDRPYGKLPSGLGIAFLTDPWGTYIELNEGLREF